MSTTHYFTNGVLNDEAGTGVTLATFIKDTTGDWKVVQRDASGKPYFGYEAKEVSDEEYKTWAARIANPDMVNYFPGIFGNGVVNKAIYEKNQANRKAKYIANLAVTRAAALLTLAKHGISKEMIYAKISEMPEAEAAVARIWFEEALSFKRSNEYLKKLGELLFFNDAQLDELFIEAAAIQ